MEEIWSGEGPFISCLASCLQAQNKGGTWNLKSGFAKSSSAYEVPAQISEQRGHPMGKYHLENILSGKSTWRKNGGLGRNLFTNFYPSIRPMLYARRERDTPFFFGQIIGQGNPYYRNSQNFILLLLIRTLL